MLERYEVAATWAVVGHLFLRSVHARRVRAWPIPSSSDRGSAGGPATGTRVDPCTDRDRDPLWYGDDVLDMLQGARVEQEIGCHSFAHVLFGDPDLTREAVDSDLDACLARAAERGLTLAASSSRATTRATTRRSGARLHGLPRVDPIWYAGCRAAAARVAHLIDQALGLPPPAFATEATLPGLWNIPGSALLIHRSGVRRAIPMSSRVRKASSGLRRARATGGVFHLWTHRSTWPSDPGSMAAGLESIVHEAADARDRGEIGIEPMAGIAERLATAPPAPGRRPDRWRPHRPTPTRRHPSR